LSGWGFAVALEEVAAGRFNVIARIGPSGVTPLLLNGHLDVVGVDGMTHEPFAAVRRDGSMFGRGSTDMKGGIAAMCVAAARAAARGALTSEIIIAAVCDEEFESIGTRDLIAKGIRATAAIITEPTRLAICPAHKGFAWITVDIEGKAAHGSRHDVGVDAIRHAGLLLSALDSYETDTLRTRHHRLLGRPSLHAAMISGGTGWSTYADHCRLRIERRTIPGEDGAHALDEIEAICRSLAEQRPTFRAVTTLECAQPPLDLDLDAPLVRQLGAAVNAASLPVNIEGLSCWTDAALFNAAGIPSLCFGPGDISRAHSATEWVEIEDIERATMVLESVCSHWGR
jgi:acetylornithine deacetylase